MKKNQMHLYEIANGQTGYFTTQQAMLAGIPDNNHSYHIKSGHWKREMLRRFLSSILINLR